MGFRTGVRGFKVFVKFPTCELSVGHMTECGWRKNWPFGTRAVVNWCLNRGTIIGTVVGISSAKYSSSLSGNEGYLAIGNGLVCMDPVLTGLNVDVGAGVDLRLRAKCIGGMEGVDNVRFNRGLEGWWPVTMRVMGVVSIGMKYTNHGAGIVNGGHRETRRYGSKINIRDGGVPLKGEGHEKHPLLVHVVTGVSIGQRLSHDGNVGDINWVCNVRVVHGRGVTTTGINRVWCINVRCLQNGVNAGEGTRYVCG